MTTIYTKDKKIEIPFPEEVFNFYLKRFNLKSVDELNDVNIFLITKKCFKDFKKGLLSLDSFSTIGDYFFSKSSINNKRSSFGSILLDIGELNFYIRNSESKFSEIGNFLSDIDEYFQNH